MSRLGVVWECLWRASWQGAIFVLVAAALCRALRGLPSLWHHLLWVLVLGRLLLPVTPDSCVSFFRLTRTALQSGWSWRHNRVSGTGSVATSPAPSLPLPAEALAPSRQTTKADAGTSTVPYPSVGGQLPSDKRPWAVVWALGVLVMALREARARARLTRRLRACPPLREGRAWDLLERTRAEVGVRRKVTLRASSGETGPAVTGVFRPVVLLPAPLAASMTDTELGWVLRHEVTHIRRWDLAFHCGWRLALALHWFNPLVWWAWRQARADAELACDEAALSGQSAPERRTYGYALLRTMAWDRTAGTVPPGAVGALMDRSGIARRVRRIATGHRQTRRSLSVSAALLFAVAAVFMTDARGGKPLLPSTAPAAAVTPPARASAPEAGLRTMRFRVTDAEGEPIPGAAVHLSIWSPDKAKPKRDYVCGPKGEAMLALPRRIDILRIWASAPGRVPMFTHWERERKASGAIPAEFTVILPKGTAIGGEVVDPEGQAISGARVEVSLDQHPSAEQARTLPSTWLAEGEDACVTDADGKWELDNVPEGGHVSVKLSHPEFLSDTEYRSQEGDREGGLGWMADLRKRTLVLTMQRGVSVGGRITDPDGNPVPGAVVIRGENPYLESGSQEVTTDANGRYRFPPVSPGPLTVTVVARGWAPDLRRVPVGEKPGSVDFRLQRGRNLRIQVVDSNGKPVPGAWMQLELDGDGWRGSRSLYNIRHPNVLDTHIPRSADENGLYQWEWAPDDAVVCTLGKEGYESQLRQKLAAGDTPHTVVLRRMTVVHGTVVDATTGTPIPDFTVVPGSVVPGSWMLGSRTSYNDLRFASSSGHDGTYRFSIPCPSRFGETPREVCVTIEAPGYESMRSGPLKPFETTVRFDIRLKRTSAAHAE